MKRLKQARLHKSRGCRVLAIMITALPDKDPRATGEVPRRTLPSPQAIESNASISLVEESLAS
jgi:hypothetical protein